MSEPGHDLTSVIGRLEDTILDLKQRVAFLELLLDMQIRVTDAALRGHVDWMIAAIESAIDVIEPSSRYFAREFIIRMRERAKELGDRPQPLDG